MAYHWKGVMNFITVTLFPAMFFSSTIQLLLLLTDYKCTAFEGYFDKVEQMVLQLKKYCYCFDTRGETRWKTWGW